jgi:signal peptidase II
VLDQVVKFWTRSTLSEGEFWKGGPWPGVFEITLTYNKGIAFGMFQGVQLFMAPIALIIAGIAVFNIHKGKVNTRWMTVSLAFLASGALGNLIDRVGSSKGVTDMFLLRLSNITNQRLGDFWVFNIADVCISTAMVMLAIVWMRPDEVPPVQAEATSESLPN